MALISDYTTIAFAQGILKSLDITHRNVSWEGFVTVGTPYAESELRIVMVHEYVGLTEQCAKDYAGVNRSYQKAGGYVDPSTSKAYWPSRFSRTVSFNVSEDTRQVKSFIATRTVETQLDLWQSAYTPPSCSIESGKQTYPFNATISTIPNGSLVSAWGYYLPLYGAVHAMANITVGQSTTKTLKVRWPMIFVMHGWDSNMNASSALYRVFV